jgi:serine/threonine protein kinase
MMPETNPAMLLTGMVLDGGWRVKQLLPRGAGTTGGNFSICYLVERLNEEGLPTGEVAFLKALDYSRAGQIGLPFLKGMQFFVNAFAWESDLVQQCAARRMSNVVLGLDAGEIPVPGGQIPVVNYLIFERAEEDVRKRLDRGDSFELAWKMRVLHDVANGLRQLHGVGVLHQDVKPSNVLLFNGGGTSKVGDLGSASQQGRVAQHDGFDFPGDPGYAPPELLYGEISSDFTVRRRAADLYLLGSMILFMFTKIGTTSAISQRLHPNLLHSVWADDYRAVLPHIRAAFDQVAEDLRSALPSAIADDVVRVFKELCDPDPVLRGHISSAEGSISRYSLDRYVTHFDRLAKRAQIELRSTPRP